MPVDQTPLILQTAEALLAPFGLPAHRPSANRLDMRVEPDALLDVVKCILDARILDVQWGYLSTITGLDHPGSVSRELGQLPARPTEPVSADDGSIETMYHFCSGAAVLTLHVWVTYSEPVLPSVTNLIPAAVLYETELAEMFGVRITGSPGMKEHLLLPDDWPQNVYPLRKSFTGLKETGEK